MILTNISTLRTDNPGHSDYYPVISGDGTKIAFESYVYDPGLPDSAHFKIYVTDLTTGATTLEADLPNAAYGLDEPDHNFVLTQDGQNLIYDDAPNGTPSTLPYDEALTATGVQNIYEKNLATGVVSVVSSAADGTLGDGVSSGQFPSADGRYLIFASNAGNLVPGQTNRSYQIYVKDTVTGDIKLVSTNATGMVADTSREENSDPTKPFNQDAIAPVAISPDGNIVAFSLRASNLVPGVNNDHPQIYVKNLITGAVSLASSTLDGTPANSFAAWETFSSDDNTVVFHTPATNLLPGVDDGFRHVYMKNLSTGALTLIDADGSTPLFDDARGPIQSSDGKYVVFDSRSYTLNQGGQPFFVTPVQVYVKNLTTGSLTLLSQDANGNAGNQNSSVAPAPDVFSADDSKIIFSTQASNIAGSYDGRVILADGGPAPTESLSAIAGDNVVESNEVGAVTFSGTSDAIFGTVYVAIDTIDNTIGTTTVGVDGTWSLTADLSAFSTGDHTEIATVQGSSWLSTTDQHAFTIDRQTPIPTLTLSNITANAVPTITGTADAGDTVTLSDGTTVIGTTTADATTGAFSFTGLSALAAGEHDLTATAKNASDGTSAASNPLVVEVGTAATIVGELDALETKAGLAAIVLTDTHVLTVASVAAEQHLITSDAAALAAIQGAYYFSVATTTPTSTATSYYNSAGVLLTTSTTKSDGSTTLDTFAPSGTLIRAGITYADKSQDIEKYGITGQSFTTEHNTYNGAGVLTSQVRTHADGTSASSYVLNTDGSSVLDTFNASGILTREGITHADKSQDITKYSGTSPNAVTEHDVLNAQGTQILVDQTQVDGSHKEFISGAGQTLTSTTGASDIFNNPSAGSTTFVFNPSFGQDLISGFHAGAGSNHDTIHINNPALNQFSDLVALMSSSGAGGQDTLITIDPHDTILLKHVAISSLNAKDFSFNHTV